jgi:N-acetylglucosaminyl-diphospho-decaprenol L-rhamnosyltransferase
VNIVDEFIAVIVVAYNSEHLLAGLLASLPLGLKDLRWHLTVADNASSDGTVALVERLAPEATVLKMGRNAGYAAAINAAVAAAPPHTAVLVLNPDVRLEAGCGQQLLAALRVPGTGVAVPRLEDGDGALSLTMRREPTIRRAIGDALLGARRVGRSPMFGELVTDRRRYEIETETDWAEGSIAMISAECWRRCGPWDESFFLYSEETDFELRARDAGFVVRFTPSARAIHLGGDSRRSPHLWSLLTVNRVRLYHRRHGRLRAAAYWCVVLLRELSRASLGRATSRAAVRALLSPRHFRVAA